MISDFCSASPRNAASKARAAAVGVRMPATDLAFDLSETAGDGGGGTEMLEQAIADFLTIARCATARRAAPANHRLLGEHGERAT